MFLFTYQKWKWIMARKQRNGLNRNASNKSCTIPESVDGCLSNKNETSDYDGNIDREVVSDSKPKRVYGDHSQERLNNTKNMGCGKKNKKRPGNVPCRETSEDSTMDLRQPLDGASIAESDLLFDASGSRSDDSDLLGRDHDISNPGSGISEVSYFQNLMDYLLSSIILAGKRLEAVVVVFLKTAIGWLERQKPHLTTLLIAICDARDYICAKVKPVSTIICTWLLYVVKLVWFLSFVWLDCAVRGLDSLLQLGTTSFLTVIWCSIFSITAMIGITKMLISMVVAALLTLFIGLPLTILITIISSTVILWLYGSFWMTGFVIILGGTAFALGHERVALFLTALYSMHCARIYTGWIGLFFGLNMSFITSDVLILFLKKLDERGSNSFGQARQNQGAEGRFNGGSWHSSPADDAFQPASARANDHSAGDPSTSGAEFELTSESEVARLLNCNDHYSALGLSRYENIDVTSLKREYRKKAMLVHPDKNMGNEKAAEAFKKLQNAYEVLLDSLKRKTYDDELRRAELLNYFRRFHNGSQNNGRSGIFSRGFTRHESEDGTHEDSRRIACNKCNNFHIWTHTRRLKSQARWCQDCNEFHQAKDGDGWVEQSFRPLLFGLLQRMETPYAYVCADSRIYDATEWFICQGMRCPANTHKPSFHVNASVTSKHNSPRGSGPTHRGNGGMPSANMDETMTEEEFFEWLQNAVQSGMFEASTMSGESPPTRAGSSSKSNVKKKRKGKN